MIQPPHTSVVTVVIRAYSCWCHVKRIESPDIILICSNNIVQQLQHKGRGNSNLVQTISPSQLEYGLLARKGRFMLGSEYKDLVSMDWGLLLEERLALHQCGLQLWQLSGSWISLFHFPVSYHPVHPQLKHASPSPTVAGSPKRRTSNSAFDKKDHGRYLWKHRI